MMASAEAPLWLRRASFQRLLRHVDKAWRTRSHAAIDLYSGRGRTLVFYGFVSLCQLRDRPDRSIERLRRLILREP
jgi:hypothetical protein